MFFAAKVNYRCQIPVMLLAFNRPDAAKKVLTQIARVRPPRLYVHIDGPRPDRQGEAEKVAAVRALLDQIDWPCEVHSLIREKNFGLRDGVRSALDWLFEQEDMAIIVEDDCLPNPDFFRFCETLLLQYADDHRVMHIAGSNLAQSAFSYLESSFVWSRYSLVWGWATWSRAWRHMQPELDDLDRFRQERLIERLTDNAAAQAYMLDKFRVTRARLNQSWAYAWFFSILVNDGYCIVPTRNMVENTGVGDPEATNTRGKRDLKAIQASNMDFPLRHPVERVVDARLEMAIFYHTQKRRLRLWLWRLLHIFGRR